MEWIPVALACGHLVEGQAWYEVGGGKPPLVECPEGCGMVEFVLPPDVQGRPEGPFVEIDLGWLEPGDEIEFRLDET